MKEKSTKWGIMKKALIKLFWSTVLIFCCTSALIAQGNLANISNKISPADIGKTEKQIIALYGSPWNVDTGPWQAVEEPNFAIAKVYVYGEHIESSLPCTQAGTSLCVNVYFTSEGIMVGYSIMFPGDWYRDRKFHPLLTKLLPTAVIKGKHTETVWPSSSQVRDITYTAPNKLIWVVCIPDIEDRHYDPDTGEYSDQKLTSYPNYRVIQMRYFSKVVASGTYKSKKKKSKKKK